VVRQAHHERVVVVIVRDSRVSQRAALPFVLSLSKDERPGGIGDLIVRGSTGSPRTGRCRDRSRFDALATNGLAVALTAG
jgi:hypothetical protein